MAKQKRDTSCVTRGAVDLTWIFIGYYGRKKAFEKADTYYRYTQGTMRAKFKEIEDASKPAPNMGYLVEWENRQP